MNSESTAAPGGTRVSCSDVCQIYDVDGERVHALRNVNVEIAAGETVALFGPSGSGKSTLLSLLAGLRRPTTRQVRIDDLELTAQSERTLSRLRGKQIGVVMQNPSRSLLPYGTPEHNIRFAQRAADRPIASGCPRHESCSTASTSESWPANRRRSCPSASSSGCRSPLPWPACPNCCSPTSQAASSTAKTVTGSWR